MTAEEKLRLIDKLLESYYRCGNSEDGYKDCMIDIINEIVMFKEEEEK